MTVAEKIARARGRADLDVWDWKAIIRDRERVLDDQIRGISTLLDEQPVELHEHVAAALKRAMDDLDRLGLHAGGTSLPRHGAA